MEDQPAMGLDATVRSQDSTNSSNSKDSKVSKSSKETNISGVSKDSKESKAESCLESKHSKDVLISERRRHQHHPHPQQHLQEQQQRQRRAEAKDDTSVLMFTSCGQLLLGVVLVVFGILVLVHGAALGSTGAGLWAGAGALVSGALGVVATLASKSASGFSTAHLASSLVALALSNMSAITALTSVVRDSQRSAEFSLLAVPGEDGHVVEVEDGWSGLLASIGLLIASVAELLVSGYICVTLTPKLCGCLRSNPEDESEGRHKTRNMVHQWVIAQNHVPKNHQPIYVVQPVMPVHPIIQHPYGMHPPGKYPAGFMPAGTHPLVAPGYGAMPILPHMAYPSRPPSQMVRPRHKRHSSDGGGAERRRHSENKSESSKRMTSIGEDQVDLSKTYTGLDKRISEEFISIAMDPDRKSKASSHHGSEIGSGAAKINCNMH